jgi:hypothetical protein
MNRIGESVHTDCRQLSKGITLARTGRIYHRPGWRCLRTKRLLP